MKPYILTIALAVSISAGASAQEWVSVGAAQKAAPSTQAPLVDSSQQAVIVNTAEKSPANQPTFDSLNDELLWQLEQLQQEVASLRGLVEQQDFQIKQLQTESQDRYLDLDERVSQLYLAKSTSSKPAAGVSDANRIKSAEEQYQEAQQLVRDRNYAAASASFDQLVKDHPQHELTANALYWAGEVLLVQNKLDDALARFERVIKDFPEHGKTADSMYKAGVTLHRQNKPEEAKVWFQKVIDEYTGKANSTVNLAKSYLQRLG